MSATAQNEIRGAIYFPATAYNVDQMWTEYDPGITARDFGYAQLIHLNALRIFGSYFAYTQSSSAYRNHIDDLLTAAGARGIRVLFVIYENCGHTVDDTVLRSLKDPLRAVATQSPPRAITLDRTRWQPYRDHVKWFMENFNNDPRLLGIEVINEPAEDVKPFAHDMLAVALRYKGSAPITVGTAGDQFLEYVSDGVDVLQFHNNYPATLAGSDSIIQARLAAGAAVGLPVWMTEWQRTRPGGEYWDGQGAVPAQERYTDLASMAQQVMSYRSRMGAFFWSLMIKPAYLAGQRNGGTVNGLFWEDGAVWDLAGARIIANDPGLKLVERRRIPFEVLRFENKGTGRWLQCADFPDSTGEGLNLQAVPRTYTGDKTRWRLVRIDGEEWFRIENVRQGLWLQVTTVPDATNGRPNPVLDAPTLAVRCVTATHTGDYTRWRWVDSGSGDWYFRLQNKATGYYLQVTALTDVDGGGFDSGVQVRAVPSARTGDFTRFRAINASW